VTRTSKRLMILLALLAASLGGVVLLVIFTQVSQHRADTLELRLCIQRELGVWDEEIIEAAKASFGQKSPPDADHRIVWCEWAAPEPPPSEVVQVKRGDKVFLALANDREKCLTHDDRFPPWHVAHCEIGRGYNARPTLGIALSSAAGELLGALSQQYREEGGTFLSTPAHRLALIVDGKVYAAAVIKSRLGTRFELSGQGFSKDDLQHVRDAMLRERE